VNAEFALQLGDGVRQRGRHAMQGAGGGGEAAMTVDGIEYLQQIEGDFHVKKLNDLAKIIRWLLNSTPIMQLS
jgi:hypothetical protein